MSTPYHCWAPSYDIKHSDTNQKTIYANNAREAAERYANVLYTFFNEQFSTIEVHVKEANNHYADTYFYEVKVVVEPQFYATKTGGEGALRS
jgi:hypothetical protein